MERTEIGIARRTLALLEGHWLASPDTQSFVDVSPAGSFYGCHQYHVTLYPPNEHNRTPCSMYEKLPMLTCEASHLGRRRASRPDTPQFCMWVVHAREMRGNFEVSASHPKAPPTHQPVSGPPDHVVIALLDYANYYSTSKLPGRMLSGLRRGSRKQLLPSAVN